MSMTEPLHGPAGQLHVLCACDEMIQEKQKETEMLYNMLLMHSKPAQRQHLARL